MHVYSINNPVWICNKCHVQWKSRYIREASPADIALRFYVFDGSYVHNERIVWVVNGRSKHTAVKAVPGPDDEAFTF